MQYHEPPLDKQEVKSKAKMEKLVGRFFVISSIPYSSYTYIGNGSFDG